MVCTVFIVDPDHIPFSWLISTFFVVNILVFPVSILSFGDWNSSNSSPVPISSIIFPQSFRLSLTFPRFTTILSFFSNCFHVFPIFFHIFQPSPALPFKAPFKGPPASPRLPLYLNSQLLSLLFDAQASELSSRMSAMKAATDNAKELQKKLLLLYNKHLGCDHLSKIVV